MPPAFRHRIFASSWLFFVLGLLAPATILAVPRQAPGPVVHANGRPGVAVPVRDPGGHALDAFRAALKRASKRKGQARIAFYGASHTAADLWTGELRRRLQDRFGDAGHGFVFPIRWNLGYRHQDLQVESSKGWLVWRHKKDDPQPVGDFGYAGLTATSADPNDFAVVRTTVDNEHGRLAARLEVWTRTAPDGGTLLVEVDGRLEKVPTRSTKTEAVFHVWKVRDGPHVVRIAPAGDGPVTIYGMVFERLLSGVILDQLGIPGMRADILTHWLEQTWSDQIVRRHPDLVVLAYGTNDVGDDDEPIEVYADTWRKVLTRVRKAVPEASCLLVGPTDRLAKDALGHKHTLPRTEAVIATQQKIAAEFGCGHWDAQAAMGGPDSMAKWRKAHLATADDVHLDHAGYTWMAELFEAALLHEPRATRRPPRSR
jgi:lysophospholipase L1-like esterase